MLVFPFTPGIVPWTIVNEKLNGTWESQNYTLFFLQDGSSISGSYEPKDIKSRDPGMLMG